MRKPDYRREVVDIIRSKVSPEIMQRRLDVYHENDIAEALPELDGQERRLLYHIVNIDKLSEILEYVDEFTAAQYLGEMDIHQAVAVISRQDSDSAISILREMSKEKKRMILALMDEESQQDITLIASFEEDQIGSRLSNNYIVLNDRMTVEQAIQELKIQAEENDNISTLFVVNKDNVFCGAIDLKELIIAGQKRPIMQLAATSFPFVYGTEDTTDCLEKLRDYSENSIPVLDNSNRLIGVITSQNIIEVVDDEMGEDYAKFAGLTSEEDLTEPLKDSMRKRMPWLLILFVLGTLVSTVIGAYEGVFAKMTLLLVFQSLLTDMAGNVGTQSLAVTIRVITDEELTGKQKVRFVFKEMRVGFINGLLIGMLAFAVLGFYIYLLKGETVEYAFSVSLCIGVVMLISMMISSVMGTIVPLFFHKINMDPASVSGPLITTISDFIAVIIYYSLSWYFLVHLLGMS